MNVSYEFIDIPVICPYNEHHRIARSRIQKHIVKCEKNYPDDYKVLCPYNATHRLFKHEMMEHIITCPMRQLIEPELYQRSGNRVLMRNKIQLNTSNLIDCNECWEEELKSNCIPYTENDITFDKSNRVTKTDYKNLRPPRGFAEAMLLEEDSDANSEDMGSIQSFMGFGRGKTIAKGNSICKIGLGRGKLL